MNSCMLWYTTLSFIKIIFLKCLAESVFASCGCTPAYLQSVESLLFGENCSLYKMAICVVPSVKNFDYTTCKCPAPCSLNTPEASLVQYGKYNRNIGGRIETQISDI